MNCNFKDKLPRGHISLEALSPQHHAIFLRLSTAGAAVVTHRQNLLFLQLRTILHVAFRRILKTSFPLGAGLLTTVYTPTYLDFVRLTSIEGATLTNCCRTTSDTACNQITSDGDSLSNVAVSCEIKLFQNYFSLRRNPTEIISFQRLETCLKLFRNYSRNLLQLMTIFQHVQCQEVKGLLSWTHFCISTT